jgi:lipid-A-disaccharide synthase
MLRIGLVAGEASGDLLGAGLMRAIRARRPDAVFEGVPGPRMAAEGCAALYPMERLSVMGIAEVFGRLRELHRMRASLARHFISHPPAVFVGIDAPEFNLGLEARLKAHGVRTVHYVSPQVWAWRRRRVHKIARSADLMLTLFPFEAPLFVEQGMAVSFVGHPLADQIPLEVSTAEARLTLGLPREARVIALLPGSRKSEVGRLADAFLGAARWCLERRPDLHFVVPLVNGKIRRLFESFLPRFPGLPIDLFDGQSRTVIAAADVVLLASGTATLEAMLIKRPMVVAYRLSASSYWLARKMVYIERYAMPNLLAGEALVPEFIQDAVRPETLGPALLAYLDQPEKVAHLRSRFSALHTLLRRQADDRAAEAVLGLIGAPSNAATRPASADA